MKKIPDSSSLKEERFLFGSWSQDICEHPSREGRGFIVLEMFCRFSLCIFADQEAEEMKQNYC